MKPLLFTLLALPFFSFAQSESKYRYSTDISLTYSQLASSERVETQVGLSIYSNRHQLRLAPIIQTYSSEAVNNPKIWQITGGSASYFYNIPTQADRFVLRFRYELTIQFYENEWTGTYYDDATKDYIEYRYESKEFFSANTLGYGFMFNITKHLNFSSEIAGGGYISHIKGEQEGTPYPTNVRLDFRGYDDYGFFWKIGMGIGYKF